MTTESEALVAVDDLIAFFQPPAMTEGRAGKIVDRLMVDCQDADAVRRSVDRLVRHARRWPTYAEVLECYREEAGLPNSRNNMSPAISTEPRGECVPADQVRSLLSRVREQVGRIGLDAVPIP